MKCTRDSIGQLGIDAVVEAASAIYADHDKNRSLWDVWSHAMHHAAAVAEEIRKLPLLNVGEEKLKREIADLALWLFTMVIKLKGDIGKPIHSNEVPQDWIVRISVGASDLMWNRFPGVCPWCYCATHVDISLPIDKADLWLPCSCDVLMIAGREKDGDEIRARAKRMRRLAEWHKDWRPQSIDSWQDRISTVYRSRLVQALLPEVALHLLEEMGEVSDGLIRMYAYRDGEDIETLVAARQIRLEDELADVFSWLFGLVEKLGLRTQESSIERPLLATEVMSENRFLLSQILWDKYGSEQEQSLWCRHCKKVTCICPIVLIQSKDQVEALITKLNQLQDGKALRT